MELETNRIEEQNAAKADIALQKLQRETELLAKHKEL